MQKSGLVSISFRKLSTDEIIRMVDDAGLKAIEWGGDIHVPHGDVKKAEEVYEKCALHNIACPSYGSYYRIGTYADHVQEFNKVISSALALHCSTIRVWAGQLSTREATEAHWEKIVSECRIICDLAKKNALTVSFEFHGNTLTDNVDDAIALLKLVDRDNLFTYWQPPIGLSRKKNIEDIIKIHDRISNIHVFYWKDKERLSLKEGFNDWIEYFELLDDTNGYAMLEFVKDDLVSQFYSDSIILKELLHE